MKKEKQFEHLMVDIETLGTKSNSAIISIGAVEFDINSGEIGRTFYQNVSLKSSVSAGLNIDPDTVMWWLSQSDDARKDLSKGSVCTLKVALDSFSAFCNKDYQVWGNSARFDLGIIEDAYGKLNMNIPWDFRKERCLRTLVSFAPEIKSNTKLEGVAHNAVADCIHQINYCCKTWKYLNQNK